MILRPQRTRNGRGRLDTAPDTPSHSFPFVLLRVSASPFSFLLFPFSCSFFLFFLLSSSFFDFLSLFRLSPGLLCRHVGRKWRACRIWVLFVSMLELLRALHTVKIWGLQNHRGMIFRFPCSVPCSVLSSVLCSVLCSLFSVLSSQFSASPSLPVCYSVVGLSVCCLLSVASGLMYTKK